MTVLPARPPLPQRAWAIAWVAALFGILAYLGIALTRDESRIAAVWLPNAVLVALLLRKERLDLVLIFAAFLANVGANLLAGDTLIAAAGLSAVNGVEIMTACFGMQALSRARPDMERFSDLVTFCLVGGMAAPLFAGLIAASILSPAGQFDPQVALTWALTDSLGMLIAAPSIWVAMAAWKKRTWPARKRLFEWIAIIAGGGVLVAGVFSQSSYPLLFVATPVVLLAAFRLGALGAAAATILVAIIASAATSAGSGPIMLVQGDLSEKLHVLQGFLAANFCMSLPVAAALAGRAGTARALRQSEELNRSMLDNMREVIFKTDEDGRWTFLNPAWERLTGYTVKESLGWRTTALFPPEELAKATRLYPEIRSGAVGEHSFRARFVRKSGDTGHIDVSIRRLAGADGSFVGAIGNIRDVTEIVRQERALIERDEQLSLLAANATDAVFRLTLGGHCLYASPSAEGLLGIPPHHLIGVNLLDRFHPEDEAAVFETFADLAAGKADSRVIAYRSELMGQPGTYRWLEANCGLVREPGTGVPKEIIASIRDVSIRKTLEEDLRLASERAEHAVAVKSAFLANMSHEIRTPMNGVLGFTQMLLGTEMNEEQRRYVELIGESGESMMQLLNDILDISKIEAGRMQLAREAVDLHHSLRSAVRLMEPVASNRNIGLILDIEDAVPAAVMGDELRLKQIILNLVGNAVKFTHKGHVRVAVTVDQFEGVPGVRIEVSDTGIGIAADRLHTIFDNFSQADSSIARRFGGTGLGLSISNHLVHMMGGAISVTSKEGLGTTFTVVLPLEPAGEHQASTREPAARGCATNPGTERRMRVLVAEDHEINQELILAMVRQTGCDAQLAPDGAVAVDMVEQAETAGKPFDLVLMDMQMPGMDGIEATKQIRADGRGAARLPIIALTANAYADDIAACLASGMQHHLSKPISLPDLQHVLELYGKPADTGSTTGESDEIEEVGASIVEKLAADFAQRRADTLSLAERVANAPALDQADMHELLDLLHKLAGTAAFFGEAELGEWSGALENELRAAPEFWAQTLGLALGEIDKILRLDTAKI